MCGNGLPVLGTAMLCLYHIERMHGSAHLMCSLVNTLHVALFFLCCWEVKLNISTLFWLKMLPYISPETNTSNLEGFLFGLNTKHMFKRFSFGEALLIKVFPSGWSIRVFLIQLRKDLLSGEEEIFFQNTLFGFLVSEKFLRRIKCCQLVSLSF